MNATNSNRTMIHNIVNDFYREIPLQRINEKKKKGKEELYWLDYGQNTKITHLIKKTDPSFCNKCQKSVRAQFCINA